MKVAKTVDEVLIKYEEAEKMDCPVWERVTIFSWGDMAKLRQEILDLRKWREKAFAAHPNIDLDIGAES